MILIFFLTVNSCHCLAILRMLNVASLFEVNNISFFNFNWNSIIITEVDHLLKLTAYRLLCFISLKFVRICAFVNCLVFVF